MKRKTITLAFLFFTYLSFSNTYTVTNTSDNGSGSLRQAIQNANVFPGNHIIEFKIPTTDPGFVSAYGIWKISLLSSLPLITRSNLIIDGTSQSVFSSNSNLNGPEIILDGNHLPWADYGFHIYNASSVTIKGFIIGRFVTGIQISGANSQNNTIVSNYLGCNHNATDTLGNTYGIYVLSGPHHNTIGGSTPELKNIVSGNNHVGIRIVNSNYNTIKGNFVGLNRFGNAALRNYDGISIEGLSKYNIIGGYTAAERNYVSGNVAYGMLGFGAGCNYNKFIGNYAGTDTSGSFAIPNTYGLLFDDGASYNTLGGRQPGAGNLLSGNSAYGVFLYNFGTVKDSVIGNLIGTDKTGTSALPNANGIVIDGPAYGHFISDNIISGNLQMGLDIHIAGSDSNMVLSNKIGTDISGLLPLPNQIDGIRIAEGPKRNIIGLPSQGNIIAYNGGNGITVMTAAETSNTFSSNSIFGNLGIEIDLFPQGPTPNDAGDADNGPNLLMNYPVINSVIGNYSSNTVSISGTLDTQNPNTCKVEIFKNYGNDRFLTSVVPNQNGSWNVVLPLNNILPATSISCTATDIAGNTSEYSDHTLLTTVEHEKQENYSIEIFPNPAFDYIEITGLPVGKFEIIDYSGKPVNALNISGKIKINVSHYPQGIYFIRSIDNKKQIYLPFSVLK